MELEELLPNGPFVFHRRPVSVPGDLRISWRLALLILVLEHSRGKKASLAKLHLVTEALRSEGGKIKLANILSDPRAEPEWPFRVEPALARAIDMAKGEGLIAPESGPAYRLTPKGMRAAEAVNSLEGVLGQERAFLESHSPKITEGFVNGVIRTLSLP
jgi:hypothetical protein